MRFIIVALSVASVLAPSYATPVLGLFDMPITDNIFSGAITGLQEVVSDVSAAEQQALTSVSKLLTDLDNGTGQIISETFHWDGSIAVTALDGANNTVNFTFNAAGEVINANGQVVTGGSVKVDVYNFLKIPVYNLTQSAQQAALQQAREGAALIACLQQQFLSVIDCVVIEIMSFDALVATIQSLFDNDVKPLDK